MTKIKEKINDQTSFSLEIIDKYRPIYGKKISLALVDKNKKNNFHISNYHDTLSRLGGHPNTKTNQGRKIYINLNEGANLKKMALESLKANFIETYCEKIGQSHKNELKKAMENCFNKSEIKKELNLV